MKTWQRDNFASSSLQKPTMIRTGRGNNIYKQLSQQSWIEKAVKIEIKKVCLIDHIVCKLCLIWYMPKSSTKLLADIHMPQN